MSASSKCSAQRRMIGVRKMVVILDPPSKQEQAFLTLIKKATS